MKIGRSFLASGLPIILIFWSFLPALAEDKEEHITLNTNPPGATAYLLGDYRLIANTPAKIPTDFVGKYKTRIKLAGYDTWRGEITFKEGKSADININLHRKTRIKAGIRSLFLPGWGQYYGGGRIRATFFSTAAITSGVVAYIFDRRYRDKKNIYDDITRQYIDGNIQQREFLQPMWENAHLEYTRARNNRRDVLVAVGALWAYNVIDAMVFFPEGKAARPAVTWDGKKTNITLAFRI